MRSTLACAFALVSLAGCGGGSGANYYPPPDLSMQPFVCATALPTPSNVSQNVIYRVLPGGAITGVVPGQNVGYYITANVGGSFRLVWTGDGAGRQFAGAVFTSGHFSNVVAGCAGGFCALGAQGCVSAPNTVVGGERVDFIDVAGAAIHGFDFVVDAVPANFNITIDNQARADLVFFPATDNGGQVSNAGAIPFGLIPQ